MDLLSFIDGVNLLSFIDDVFKETESRVVSPEKETLDKVVDDPLQGETKTTPEVVGETSLPSPPKQTSQALT